MIDSRGKKRARREVYRKTKIRSVLAGRTLTEENQLLKAQIFHANSVEKLPKIHEQMNNLLAHLEKDDIVSVNTTEISFSGIQAFYSYTLLVVYQAKE